MQRQTVLRAPPVIRAGRAFLFVVFFSVGAAALSFSVLYEDLAGYYRSKQLLRIAKESFRRLESLNADYDALLRRLQEDPNLIKRIAPVTLGTKPADANAVYPRATAEQLDAARKALMEDLDRRPAEQVVPGWITRCSKPPQRITLFLAGSFLILISFIWFGSVGQRGQKE